MSRRPPSAPLRIVQVCPTYAPCVGGAERMTQAVSERLVARGHAVTVLTLNCASQLDLHTPGGAGLPAREWLNGVQVLRVDPAGGLPLRLLRWWLRQKGGYRSTSWLLGEDYDFWVGTPSGLGTLAPLLRIRADVVATINWWSSVVHWTPLALRFRRLPHVAIPVLHIERPWAQRELYRETLGQCAAAIVLTEAEADFVRERGASNVAVAGGGVDVERFATRDGAAIRARYGIGTRPVVGFVGRAQVYKGAAAVLDAMPAVWRRFPDAVLLMAGPSAHRHPDIAEKLAALTPAQRANLVLADDFPEADGPSIMDACDLLALPSIEESFGLVLAEAWMCGKPVIGGNLAATRCLIEHGVDGWIVDPANPAELAERIIGLLADPETREAFGRRGQAKVLERYTWDKVTDVWEATYRTAVSLPHTSTAT